ncbi:hypothetical protein [Micromonospora endophytica]|uniref:Uncharacterized protein n=1 Tax=Micromonospora endophytica TaxID=515350 RepID=A0A2W2CIV8_9ACTN|nr:hypothetical protein [Micromonospora endophytica]PZF92914.1 hypothetical protein C1I93_18775 [Micromonospora endophytica]RIW48768.1 hypothetical protein D3H59_06325 [Micromonospora endophytica]BCJ59986.1 hypothetical protein Jiend_34080 [Micromonospora endophytica]
MGTAIVKTPEELREWRARLLDRVHMSKETLYDLGRNFELRPDERNVYEMVRSIDYLLGDDES